MGDSLSGLNRPKEAMPWTGNGVWGFQKLFDKPHSSMLILMEPLVGSYVALGQFKKARALQHCIGLMRDTLGDEHPRTIQSEASLVTITAFTKRNPAFRGNEMLVAEEQFSRKRRIVLETRMHELCTGNCPLLKTTSSALQLIMRGLCRRVLLRL
jgi:hypothetical protein